MADKPDFRELDESPNRADDIKLKFDKLGIDFEASGKMVIAFLLTAALIGFGFFHDYKSEHEHDKMAEVQTLQAALQATQICVTALNEAERQAYRNEGKYCGDELRQVREYLRRRDALPEPRSESMGVVYASERRAGGVPSYLYE